MAGVLLGVCASLKLFLLAFVVWFVVRPLRGEASQAWQRDSSLDGPRRHGVWDDRVPAMARDARACRVVGTSDEHFSARTRRNACSMRGRRSWPSIRMPRWSGRHGCCSHSAVAVLTAWRIWSMARRAAIDEAWAALLARCAARVAPWMDLLSASRHRTAAADGRQWTPALASRMGWRCLRAWRSGSCTCRWK